MLEARRTKIVLVVLLAVAVALVTADFRDGGNSAAHGLGGQVFGPVERLAGDVAGVFGGGGNSGEVASLQRRDDQLRAQLAQAQADDADASQLARVLHLAAGRYQVVTAAVIAAGGEYSDTVTISAGSDSGITTDETVLNGDGLVGTVASVAPGTATVQLATDAGAVVGVRVAATGQIGSLTGTARSLSGGTPLRLTLFNSNAALRPGQELVTFGSVGGRPYVPGVPVGTVAKVTTEPGSLSPTALVTPYADVTALGVVGVVVSR